MPTSTRHPRTATAPTTDAQDGSDDSVFPARDVPRSSTPWSRAPDRGPTARVRRAPRARRRAARRAGRRPPAPSSSPSLRDRLMAAAETVLVPADARADSSRLRLPARQPAASAASPPPSAASPSSAPRPPWPWPPRPPCRATRSTRSSGPSRTPTPASASARRGKGTPCSTAPPAASTRSASSAATATSRTPPGVAETLNDFTTRPTEASDLLLADYAATGDQASIDELRDFTADSLAQLADLEPWCRRRPRRAAARGPGRSTRSTRGRPAGLPGCAGRRSPRSPPVLLGRLQRRLPTARRRPRRPGRRHDGTQPGGDSSGIDAAERRRRRPAARAA